MILIVDDRPENILALESILRVNNFQVDTANSGEEALKKVLKNTYSLIILDVQMPGMDGFEVAEIILGHSKSQHTPIIFLSAISKEKIFITKGYASGAIDYITKPVDPEILLLRVKSLYLFSQQKLELSETKNALLDEIAGRQEIQDELANKVEELHTILEALPLLAFSMNASGEIDYVNQAWKQYIHSTANFPTMIDSSELWVENWKSAFKKGEQFEREVKLHCPESNEHYHYFLKIVPVKKENEILKWIGTLHNIHEQKIANEILERKVEERTRELLEKNAELQQSNEELQQFTWVISHDLKEPVRKILTFSNLIKDRYFHSEQEGKREMERIIFSTERMTKLIDDLLSFTRLSAEFVFKPTDLNDLLSQIVSDYELVIHEKNAIVEWSNLCVLEAVETQFKQVLQNLIGNALKFARPGVPPSVRISSYRVDSLDFDAPEDPNGSYCRIEVKDNGIGFDEKYLTKIFQVFQRLTSSQSTEGTGIGLAIAKKSIDKHKGIITARSIPDKGSTFIIIIPLEQSKHE